MKNRFKIWTVVLAAIMTASACAPAVSTQPAAAELTQTQIPLATATAALPSVSPPSDTSTPDTSTLPVQPIATSRGPDLEATDPTTVSLASGGLQLVEFFRFT